MDFREYQYEAAKTAVYPARNARKYLGHALEAEVGEVSGVFAKFLRGDQRDFSERMTHELGDCLWMLAMIAALVDEPVDALPRPDHREASFPSALRQLKKASRRIADTLIDGPDLMIPALAFDQTLRALTDLAYLCGYTLDEIMEINLRKLADRQARGVLQGNGDYR